MQIFLKGQWSWERISTQSTNFQFNFNFALSSHPGFGRGTWTLIFFFSFLSRTHPGCKRDTRSSPGRAWSGGHHTDGRQWVGIGAGGPSGFEGCWGWLEVWKHVSLSWSSRKRRPSTESGDPGGHKRVHGKTPGHLVGWCLCFFLFGPFQTLHRQLTCHLQSDSHSLKQQWVSPSWFGLFGDISSLQVSALPLSHLFDLAPNTAATPCQEGNAKTIGGPRGPTDLTCKGHLLALQAARASPSGWQGLLLLGHE